MKKTKKKPGKLEEAKQALLSLMFSGALIGFVGGLIASDGSPSSTVAGSLLLVAAVSLELLNRNR